MATVINPDDYLETEFGREYTPERNRKAWQLAYARLRDANHRTAGQGHSLKVLTLRPQQRQLNQVLMTSVPVTRLPQRSFPHEPGFFKQVQ